MKRIGPIISLWSFVFLLVTALVGVQLAATNDLFDEFNHHGTHIESADATDNVFEEGKHLTFNLDFHVTTFYQVPLVAFSCGQLVFHYLPVSKSVVFTEFCSRAPPA
jgi:hypothetical protein